MSQSTIMQSTKKVSVTLKLPQLQNLIKRDPLGYKDEFLMQKKHFESEVEIFKLRPTKDSERFTDLVTFISHVAPCYKDECSNIPTILMELMEVHANNLHPDVRAKLMQALILTRNRGLLDPLLLLKLSFKLFSIPDKSLRLSLTEYIFNDIKSMNANKHNEKLNRGVQAVLFNVVSDDTTIASRKTVEILAELYRRRIWTDERTVNVLGKACTSSSTRVVVAAVRFFLGIETKMLEDEEEEKDKNIIEINKHEHSKKTRKRERQVEKQVEHNAKAKRQQEKEKEEAIPLFPAINLLNDPQTLAEKLFKKLRQGGEKFEVKLLIMNFVSSYLQRYLTSHQQEVTKILAYLIQGCHDMIPPEDLMPVVKAIAYNFITERCTNEVIAIGINSVREIIARVPAILHEPDIGDFVQDLGQYGKKAHKSVMIAAHGIINLIRELYPALLRNKERGKFHDITHVPNAYGALNAADGVEGAELLEAYERGEIVLDEDGEVIFKEDIDQDPDEKTSKKQKKRKLSKSVEDEDEENDSDGWVDVNSDDEGDDDDEEEDDNDESGEWVDMNSDDEGDDDGEENEADESGEWEDVNSDDEENDDEDEEEDDDNDEDEDDNDEDDDDEENDEINEAETTDSATGQQPIPRDAKTRIDATRILTNEDFDLISRLKVAAAERAHDPKYRTKMKRQRENEDDEDANNSFTVEPDTLGAGMKTSKMNKIDRIKRVLTGRKESKFEHEGHAGGLTNKEKERKKNYMMVRKGKVSVANKIRRSQSDTRYLKNTRKEQWGRDKRKRRRT